MHVTAMFVTFALPTVPELFATAQLCVGFDGFLLTVTLYVAPEANSVGSWNGPLPPTSNVAPPLLSCSPDPCSPETVPPTANVPVAQVTATLVTSSEPTVPALFATVQLCEGLAGCAATVTL